MSRELGLAFCKSHSGGVIWNQEFLRKTNKPFSQTWEPPKPKGSQPWLHIVESLEGFQGKTIVPEIQLNQTSNGVCVLEFLSAPQVNSSVTARLRTIYPMRELA